MKTRHSLAIVLAIMYVLLLVFFVLNSGAGHDWGTGAFYILSFPLGLAGIGLDILWPDKGLLLLSPVLGLFQYGLIGYMVGRKLEPKSA